MTRIVVVAGHHPLTMKSLDTTDSFQKILKEAELHLKNVDIKMKQIPICKRKNIDFRAVYLEPKKFTRKNNLLKRLFDNKSLIKKFLKKSKKMKKKKKRKKKKRKKKKKN